jgi:large subunit ribosomal protein L21
MDGTMGIYAVIKTGGKQYRVSPGDVLQVEKLSVPPGGAVEITDVFMLVKGENVAIGNPTVANVRVIAEVVTQGRGDKIRIFKKRRRKHYQKTMGHRQYYSAIRIVEIVDGDKNYRASDADASRSGISGRERKAAASPAAPLDRKLETARPKSESAIENVIPSQRVGASPVSASGDQPLISVPPPLSVGGLAKPIVEERTPASTAFEPIPPITLSAVSGEFDSPDALATKPEEPRHAVPPDSRTTSERPTGAQAFAAVDIGPREESRTITGERTPAALAAMPNEEKSRRKGMFWFLTSLLALLLGGLGWWFKGDENPAGAPARVDAQPANQATTPPAPRPPIKEIRLRKPVRAATPSAPDQPPD